MSTGEAFSFYKFGGEVDQSALAPLVATQKHQEVIGWFKFRRETPLRPSLREAAIHSSLHSTLHPVVYQFTLYSLLGKSGTPFIFALFSSSSDHVIKNFDYRIFYTSSPAARSILRYSYT